MQSAQAQWLPTASVLLSFLAPVTGFTQTGSSPQSSSAQVSSGSAQQSQSVIRAGTRLLILDVVAAHRRFDRQSDNLEHAAVNCVVWAYPGKGNPIRSEGESNAALKADVFQQVMQNHFSCTRAIELKPGRYTLRLGVLDRTTSLMGSTSVQVTVP
jgi:hypothetical protein